MKLNIEVGNNWRYKKVVANIAYWSLLVHCLLIVIAKIEAMHCIKLDK